MPPTVKAKGSCHPHCHKIAGEAELLAETHKWEHETAAECEAVACGWRGLMVALEFKQRFTK